MKNHNKGFSLLELIVVVAIMVLVAGAMTLVFNVVFGWKAKECTNKISGYLNTTKTEALSRDNCEMNLFYDTAYRVQTYSALDVISGNNRLSGTPATLETTQVGDASLTIKVVLSNGDVIDVKTRKVTVGYDRSSGAFHPVKLDGSSSYAIDPVTTEFLYIQSIQIEQGAHIERIVCAPLTGKHYID